MLEDEKKISNIRNIGIIAHIDAGKTTTTESVLYLTGRTHEVGKVHEGTATMDHDKQEQERGITIFSAATTAQTETVWRQANKYKTPRLIFVNKMDGVDNVEKFTENLRSIQEKLYAVTLVAQFPIGVGKELEGVVDVIGQKAYYFQMGDKDENYQVKEIPSNLLKKTKEYRKELIEKIIDLDENLTLKYLEGKELQVEEIKNLLRRATLTGKYFPVFCGSAYKHVGIKLVLDGVVDYLPSPQDVKEILAFSPRDKTKPKIVNYSTPLPCLALAFKIVVDNYNNKLTFFRVYAGKVLANSYVYNVNRDKRERVSRLVRMYADKKEEIKEAGAGDIAVAIGLEHTITGDTFGEEKEPLLLETINFAEPETGQMIIAGMGELHLEVSIERLKSEYRLAIESEQQKPNEGRGFEFVDAKKGQEMSDTDAKEVKEGLEEAMSLGLLLGYPLLDIKATLLKGERHSTDTKPGDFKEAAILAFRGKGTEERKEKIEKLGVVLLEPIMQLEVVAPKDYMGNILSDLGSRRTIIENTEEREGSAHISGKTPLKEMLNYLTTLRQLTGGRERKCTQVVEGASLENWCMLNGIPEVRILSLPPKIKHECVAINVNHEITLLIPDDNSSIVVKQIKNRQEGDYFTTSFSNLEFKPNFLNLKENNQLEKIAANEPPLPAITFKVISQKRNDNESQHLLGIEPLDLGIENLPKIKQILFCFYGNCSGASTTSKSLKESKFYNSNILAETAGKTFTMKIKHIHLGLKGGKYGNDTLTFQRDTDFE
nr:1760_t:CDS:2 [Entrophospora candida]